MGRIIQLFGELINLIFKMFECNSGFQNYGRACEMITPKAGECSFISPAFTG